MSDQQAAAGDAGPTEGQVEPQADGVSSAAGVPATAGGVVNSLTPSQPPPPEWPPSATAGFHGTAPLGAYVQAPSAYYYGQGVPAGYGYLQPRPQANSNAIVALVLAIVAWLAVPVIPAIVALVLAGKASKEIEASNGWLTGSGMALTAKILSWINIAFSVLIGVFVAFILIAVIASGAIEPSTVPTSEFGT